MPVTKTKVGLKNKLNFGKYKDKFTVEEILDLDLQYMIWLHNNASNISFTAPVVKAMNNKILAESQVVTSDKLFLTLNRSGNFIGTRSTKTQCGIEGSVNYLYSVAVTCLEQDVDPTTGFLFDNKIVEDYFVDKYVKKKDECPSCERMAAEAARYFHSMLINNGITARQIRVDVGGSPQAFMRAEINLN